MPVAEQGHNIYWIYPFIQFPATSGSASRKAPSLPGTEQGKKFRLDLSISGNFQQLWVQLAVKHHPSPEAKQGNILDWIYLFQAISGNFGFSWQKTP